MLTLTIASGNPRKVAEIEAMLGPLPLKVVLQPPELEVEETGTSYFENALLKASAAAQLTGT
ncbi:MAG: non-canonical purine NTP pyrophosphatase, partial [Cyanobacteria bacterium]|nr:non-canonical purine NTP pyrophosphatase [Cyanobacteriota bacterium]